MQLRSMGVAALALLACGATGAAAQQQPQQWPNSPLPSTGRPVFPFFEGWYQNEDGSVTLSFGYLNRNPDEVVEIPLGDRNYIEPRELDGIQPTHFLPSRNRGVFAITLPASERDTDVWWYLTDEDGNEYKVPGRASSSSYELDWMPRPHGTLPPLMWFESESEAGRGPGGVWAEETLRASVGEPVTLTVTTRDPSEHDPSDPRFREPIPVRVVWSKYQGPEAEVTFTRHESNPLPEPSDEGARQGGGRGRAEPPPPEEIELEEGRGTASVVATFNAPGTYIMRAQADNWDAPDSSSGDQCCWTNAYVRVEVSP
ncbi:MAG TPA: hypothetical protein VFQ22_09635 [Longimicrobiales bacterium]|nr:hypothetical protein [Longimicrobiales bacterium]